MAIVLLLFGAAFEVGHLDHHIRHSDHHDEADAPKHRACLIFQTGMLVEAVEDVVGEPVVLGAAPAVVPVSPPDADGPSLPDTRAPPCAS